MVTDSPFSLRGHRVLLTGGTGHLGRVMAVAMLDSGAELLFAARDPHKVEDFLSGLGAEARARCTPLLADLGTPEGVHALAAQVRERGDRLHGLVNNATAARLGELRTITAEDFAFSAQRDMVAPFLLVQQLLPLLERAAAEDGEASVVNLATMYASVSPRPQVYGDSGLNNPVQYGAAKAGLMQMTRYLACHIGPSRIRVNSVAPGPFPETSKAPAIPGFYETLAGLVPLARVGKAPEVAWPVVFLLSRAASFVNGANLPIDGGWTAW